mmetsp:Transcript_91742/g.239161  ORF Transcript_91742/g.239161 Transcript_91742/m.239161 type:complete len:377 (+) Transcript_91742:269-1399(+)
MLRPWLEKSLKQFANTSSAAENVVEATYLEKHEHGYNLTPTSGYRVEILGTQFQQCGKGLGEVLEEHLLVVRVEVDILLEARILQERNVRWKHHELLRRGVAVLGVLAGLPFDAPLFPVRVLEELEIQIVERRGCRSPRAHEARGVRVAAPERMSAAEGDNFLVVEPHAGEDAPQVADVLLDGAVGGVRQPAVGGDVAGARGVDAPGTPGDLRTPEGLDGNDAAERVQVRVADAGVRLLHGLEPRDRLVEPRVPAMRELLLEADGPRAGTPRLRDLVVAAARVPRQPDQRRAFVRVGLDELRDLSLGLLHGRRRELLRGGRRLRHGCHRGRGQAREHAAAPADCSPPDLRPRALRTDRGGGRQRRQSCRCHWHRRL